MTAVTNQC